MYREEKMIQPAAFLSHNPGLNAALCRYFTYIHHTTLTASTFDYQTLPHRQSTGNNVLIVHNEVLINDEICGIYPFWFNWGLQNNIEVYGLSYEKSDPKNKILYWEDFLDLDWQNNGHSSITYQKIPHFDSAQSIVHAILKPHGSDSLFDLSAKLHFSFVGVLGKLEKKSISESMLKGIKINFIDKGTRVFWEFQKKEKKYHRFLSLLPGNRQFFSTIEGLMDSINGFERVDFQANNSAVKELLIGLFRKIQGEIQYLCGFFENLEQYLRGEKNDGLTPG